jgi:hypothetical protein
MKVDLDTQAVFTRPLESFKDILPAGTGHERFVAPCLDRPERNRDPDPIQTGASDIGKILLSLKHDSSVLASVRPRDGFYVTHDESFVVVLKLRKPTTAGIRGHRYAEGPLIDGLRLVFLEKRRGNEGFENKPTTEVESN